MPDPVETVITLAFHANKWLARSLRSQILASLRAHRIAYNTDEFPAFLTTRIVIDIRARGPQQVAVAREIERRLLDMIKAGDAKYGD